MNDEVQSGNKTMTRMQKFYCVVYTAALIVVALDVLIWRP